MFHVATSVWSPLGPTIQHKQVWPNSPVAAAAAAHLCATWSISCTVSNFSLGFPTASPLLVSTLSIFSQSEKTTGFTPVGTKEERYFHIIFKRTICVTTIVKQLSFLKLHILIGKIKTNKSLKYMDLHTFCLNNIYISPLKLSSRNACTLYGQSCMSSARWLFFTYVLKCSVVFVVSQLLKSIFSLLHDPLLLRSTSLHFAATCQFATLTRWSDRAKNTSADS